MMAVKQLAKTGPLWIPSQKMPLLLGMCVPADKSNASKLRIRRVEFNDYLNMYFRKFEFIYVTDPEKKCKTGDIVLAKILPEKLTTLITHEVVEIVHPLGDVTCPITGKKSMGVRFRDEMEEEIDFYGENETRFNYKKARPRGWQEGKKDFTDKIVTKKFHMFPEDDPYTVYK